MEQVGIGMENITCQLGIENMDLDKKEFNSKTFLQVVMWVDKPEAC